MSRSVDLGEFVAGFLVEAEEHLRTAKSNLLTVDEAARKGEASPRAVRELFRSLHTIKGLAAMVGVDPIVDIAHGMEAVLRAADRGAGKLSPAAVEPLIAGSAAIEQRVRALAEGKAVPAAPPGLVAALAALEPCATPPRPAHQTLALPAEIEARLTPSEREQLGAGLARGARALRADFVPTPARAEQGVSITTVRERVAKLAEIVKILPLSLPRSEEAPGGLAFALLVLTTATEEAIAAAASITPAALQPLSSPPEGFSDGGSASKPPAEGSAGPDGAPRPLPAALAEAPPIDAWLDEGDRAEHPRSGVVRVSVDRLDDAMEKLSALIVTRSRLERAIAALAADRADVRALRQIAADHTRQIRDLRAAILKLRMIPTREMLEPLLLIVRGLRAATGKQVRLELDAGHAELDKAVAERILPAIVHLVRNAVDHGVEPPEARRRAGKPEEGLVTISCFERSNTQLELSVADDGGGIDREAVARRAGREVPRTDAGILELLALPGLSTRDTATKTSGRGLGMDIVKRITEELGGELLLRTAPGKGSTFVLRVPLTVTIVDAFAFQCGEQTFVVPVAMVEEIIDLDPARLVEGPRPAAVGSAGGSAGGPAARPRVSLLERRGEVVPLVALERPLLAARGARPAAQGDRRAAPRGALRVPRGSHDGPAGDRGAPARGPAGQGAGGARRHRPGRRPADSRPRSRRPQRRALPEPRGGDRVSTLYVVFKVAAADYAIAASEVLQMESFTSATRVPGTPAYVAGLVQIRSRVVPVVDLRARFGLPAVEPTLDSRVIVVQQGERVVSLLVDSAREVADIPDPESFRPPPEIVAEQAAGFVKSVAQVERRSGERRLVMLVNFEKVIGEERAHGK